MPLDMPRIEALVRAACEGLSEFVTPESILAETVKNLYDGVPLEEVHKSAILAARALIEKDPAYSAVSLRACCYTRCGAKSSARKSRRPQMPSATPSISRISSATASAPGCLTSGLRIST